MISLLSKKFIKNSDDFSSPAVRRAYGILCGAVGIFFNILLCCLKFIAASITGSVSIAADALNNLSDAGSSVVTLIGFRLAGQNRIILIPSVTEESSIFPVLLYP